MTSPGPEIQFRRSARARRLSLRIDPASASVIVTLPPRSTQAAGRALLQAHAGWVTARLARLPAALVLADGASIPLGGVPHVIRHGPGGPTRIVDRDLLVSGAAEFLPRRVLDFLRAEAKRRLSALALSIATEAGLTPRRVVIRDTKSRWGSCTAEGTLMFCWRLVMAPPAVQHYVVAHEVAHLRHMNHSLAFWALVAELTPHRATADAWLDQHGAGLVRLA